MQWESWAAFFNMGGYAFYVWFSFVGTLLCVMWEIGALRKRHAALVRLAQQKSVKWLVEN